MIPANCLKKINVIFLNPKCLDKFQQALSTFQTPIYREKKLTLDEVNEVINANAICEVLKSNRVTHFYSNQVGVNRPIEDRWNVGCLNLSNFKSDINLGDNTEGLGHIFSVVDGHNGHTCAHVVNYLHMEYVVVSLLNDHNMLSDILDNLRDNHFFSLTKSYVPSTTWGTIATSVREAYYQNLQIFIHEFISQKVKPRNILDALIHSLYRLDRDIIYSALPTNSVVNRPLLRSATSGCVGTFVYVPENVNSIYVAQVGDCGAVLGSFDSVKNEWLSELLVQPHNSNNFSEVERLESEHPINESCSIIRENRLLGELMPFRAFGDVRFKWTVEDLRTTATLLELPPSYPVTPQFYMSPPYLTASPEVREVPIDRESAKFLIVASDGLWDLLPPSDAVKTVGNWWQKINTLNLTQISCKGGENAATILIKTALGGKEMDYKRLSGLLSMPGNVGRYYRDDITVIVMFFK